MAFPPDLPAQPAGSRDLLITEIEKELDARARRVAAHYYGWRFKYELLQAQIRQEPGDHLSDFEQHMLHTTYPTFSQYLAYLSQLEASRDDTQQTDREPGR